MQTKNYSKRKKLKQKKNPLKVFFKLIAFHKKLSWQTKSSFKEEKTKLWVTLETRRLLWWIYHDSRTKKFHTRSEAFQGLFQEFSFIHIDFLLIKRFWRKKFPKNILTKRSIRTNFPFNKNKKYVKKKRLTQTRCMNDEKL